MQSSGLSVLGCLDAASHFVGFRLDCCMVTCGIMGLNTFWIWVVVKIMVPFWVPIILRHLIFRVPKKGHNFDNHPYLLLRNLTGHRIWGRNRIRSSYISVGSSVKRGTYQISAAEPQTV